VSSSDASSLAGGTVTSICSGAGGVAAAVSGVPAVSAVAVDRGSSPAAALAASRLGVRQVGQATGLAAAAGKADPQLGQAEHPGQARADGVDRLDATQRKRSEVRRISPLSTSSTPSCTRHW